MIPFIKSIGSLIPLFFTQSEGTFWMPPASSETAGKVDFVFYFVFWISAFFFALIVGLMVLFLFLYREKKGVEAQKTAHHNTPLELTWTIIPSILVVIIFWLGFKTFMDITTPPQNAQEIRVTAQQWKWFFTYPNGYVAEDLHVPVDKPILLTMSSVDVIHSFFVPAFRTKMDVVPGRYTKVWFKATETGEFVILCAEYCGTSHSDMVSQVVVHEPGGYEKWLADASNWMKDLPPVEIGKTLVIGDKDGRNSKGCKQCHSVDGTAHTGPTLKGIFGHEVKLRDGSSVLVDDGYIRESLENPQAKVVAGFDPVMPTYKGRLKDDEINAIIDYIKSLSGIEPTKSEESPSTP